MADSVTSTVLVSGLTKRVIHLQSVSDGTGESDVVKVDVSAITGTYRGKAVETITIDAVQYAISGFTSVRLEFDATTDDKAVTLPTGSGILDFEYAGGINDPKSSGYTGDLLLTTAGNAAGATYDITLYITLNHA